MVKVTVKQNANKMVAQTPGAWVITGGTNTGVMKQVGEALQGTSKACIGISTWGIITNANKLISAGDKFGGGVDYQVACSLVQRGAFLDHNHTHHLMVDDGSIGKYGKEIPLRSRLEEYIMKEVHVPSVLMVIEGGPGTLDTVLAALMKEPPLSVVIIVGSGRAADLLAYTYNRVVDIDAVYNVCDKLLFNKLLDLLPELQSQTKERQMDFYKVVLNCMRKRDFILIQFITISPASSSTTFIHDESNIHPDDSNIHPDDSNIYHDYSNIHHDDSIIHHVDSNIHHE
nr:transient receptor potential cation channel subfamily M member-like 2 [Hydra vulgaris]